MSTKPVGAHRPRILVIDDDMMVLRVLSRRLGRRYNVVGLTSAERALALLDAGLLFDAILCDVVMPGLTGVGFLSAVEQRHPELARRIVFISGELCDDTTARFIESVANPLLTKPWDPVELDSAIAEAIGDAA